MKTISGIQIPDEWSEINIDALRGIVMVIGSSDSGKSTFVWWLVRCLCRTHKRIGWLDGDIGQSTLGVPTTMNLAIISEGPEDMPPPTATFFVGSNSPRDHLLPTLVGAHRLVERAGQLGATVVIVDTTGFVTEKTGRILKEWKIELLRPDTVFVLRREGELEHIIDTLRRDKRFRLIVLPSASAARFKSAERRAGRRRALFRRYFQSSRKKVIDSSGLAVYGLEGGERLSLIALQDSDGFCLALGVLLGFDDAGMTIMTPIPDMNRIASIRVGSLRLDPATGIEF